MPLMLHRCQAILFFSYYVFFLVSAPTPDAAAAAARMRAFKRVIS
jgi:hypothetical protein